MQGEQSRIANDSSRINSKKSETEKLYTVIMNEYRDKSSQLTTFQTQAVKNLILHNLKKNKFL